MKTLNEVFSSLSAQRRYEVWFLRLGLANGEGAWWFRYLLLNPGRGGCPGLPQSMPLQVWATWFPTNGKVESVIQGFDLAALDISPRGKSPFHFRIGHNSIDENRCQGKLETEKHSISWDLNYRSTFRTTLSSKGWIGFSRTPHSDALFTGQITLDGRNFSGEPLGFGVQGHNCGYRHRKFWRWAHAYFLRPDAQPSTLEALVYEMPLGLVFRKAVLWHNGEQCVSRKLLEIKIDRQSLLWDFRCAMDNGLELEVTFKGSEESTHRVPYTRTDCRGSLEVLNNSLAMAKVSLKSGRGLVEKLETSSGAVLEMGGSGSHPNE